MPTTLDETPALDERELPGEPIGLLQRWLDDAVRAGCADAWAMTLATSSVADGPSARTVLLAGLEAGGLRFHTSHPTQKTNDLDADPRAAAVLRWEPTGRQVAVRGVTQALGADDLDAAFDARPPALHLLAWLYESAPPGASAAEQRALWQRLARRQRAQAASGSSLSRPAGWRGYVLQPDVVDFWQRGLLDAGTPNERVRYRREASRWTVERMLP